MKDPAPSGGRNQADRRVFGVVDGSAKARSKQISPFFWAERVRDYIANDGTLPLHEIEDVVRIFFDGDKLCHRLAAFSDPHGFPVSTELRPSLSNNGL
jgi:hypothetical protein